MTRACHVPACFQKLDHEGDHDLLEVAAPVTCAPLPPGVAHVIGCARRLVKVNSCLASSHGCICTYCNLKQALADLGPVTPELASLPPWKEYERDYFRRALILYADNKSKMALGLGLNRRSLYRTLQRLGLHTAR